MKIKVTGIEWDTSIEDAGDGGDNAPPGEGYELPSTCVIDVDPKGLTKDNIEDRILDTLSDEMGYHVLNFSRYEFLDS